MVLVFATAFAFGFTALFGWLAVRAVRSGAVTGIGWSLSRVDHPFLFWGGVAAWTLNASVGAAFTFVLCGVLVS